MSSETKPTFNLLDEPWIPVRSDAGEVQEVCLTDALLKAGNFAALAETSPPNLIALYRLLFALLHRALTTRHDKWGDTDRARWFRGGLPEAPLRSYLEQWRDRFWLFHPTNPFMQVAKLSDAEETRNRRKPWTQIALEGANGNTPVMFDHSLDDAPTAIPLALACRNLLGFLQFTPGGLVKTVRESDKAGALANTAAAVPTGHSLSQTLVLGLHPWDGKRLADDMPAWERPAPTVVDLRAKPTLATGPNDRYTRLSRAVLLLPDDEFHHVSHVCFAAGIALEDDPNAPDPMACYRINKDGKAIRVSFTEGRATWRDLPSLVPDASRSMDIPASILAWSADLYRALGQWNSPVQVLTAGLSSDHAKLLRWRVDRIELPQAFLINQDSAAELREQVRFSDEIYSRLRGLCAGMIASTMPDPNHKDTRTRAKSILENGPTAGVFFSTAERALPKLMQQIAAGDFDAAYRDWMAVLADATRQAWEATRRSLGDSPAVLRAEARAYPRFKGLLNSLDLSETDTANSEETIA
jgi:CRISPR system Cascade subunit CasA